MGLPYVPFRVFFVEGIVEAEGEGIAANSGEVETKLDLVPL